MILGVDVWSGYGKIDWARVAAAGVKFAIVKCTEGNEPARNDKRFTENVAGAKAAGIYVGAYHFAYPLPDAPGRPGRSPEEQARRAWVDSSHLGALPGELPPSLDAEWPELGEWGKWGVTAASMSEWFHRYCVEMERISGRKPLLYTYPFFWRAIAASSSVAWAKDYPLWIASYKDTGEWMPKPLTAPHVVSPWDGDWTLWQFSADGSPISIPGIPACPIDRNVFRGDLDGLRRLANIDPEADTLPEGMPSRRPPEVTDLADFRKVYTPPPLRGQDDDPDDAA
jgi:lysozyme